ncbi:MAG: hypothetical protein WB660_27695 [Candidatus Sulfotelmatobacter sp.]
MKLGVENRGQTIAAIALGAVLLLILAYEIMPSSSTNASTSPAPAAAPQASPAGSPRPATRRNSASTGKKERPAQNLDPTLHLQQLASTEQIKYEGSGRNIFIAQADTSIPMPVKNGTIDKDKKDPTWQVPAVAAPPPIPLKFFGFASHPGEPKKIFLSKGDDVFIAGEGEIVDRRYKVVRISPTSVEIQDVVGSGPPQSIPLTQG